jgi:hemerythrin-like domain-containing protein
LRPWGAERFRGCALPWPRRDIIRISGLMLRDQNLVPLSRQHQHSLALCVRLARAGQITEVDLEAWQAEIAQQFEQEISIHFAAEEQEVFPRAAEFPEMQALVGELLGEHAVLRGLFARAGTRDLDRAALADFGEKLAAHIRKEERQLFEAMQKRMDANQLAAMGSGLEKALADAALACFRPGTATRAKTGRDET